MLAYWMLENYVREFSKYVSWNMWTQSCSFFTALGLVWEAALKKIKTKLQSFTKELRLSLVFMCNSTTPESFDSYFSRVCYKY